MSRSRKAPFVKDRNPGMKAKANRKVRRRAKRAITKADEEIGSGKSYKKVFNSYDISDFCFPSDRPKDKRK